MVRNKIILIQVWLGKIPDYFWFHYETTKNLKNVDFLFVTDQEITLDSKNYKVIKLNTNDIVNTVSELLGVNIEIKNNKKICDLKSALGDVFYEYIRDYDYFGCYDIDTLFGDFDKYVTPFLGQYDVISIADKQHHNRLSGPFLIMKNTNELRTLYKTDKFIECFQNENVLFYEEIILNELVKDKFTVKLIYSMNNDSDGKIKYDNVWSGGKNYTNGEEIFLYHFYRKDRVKFNLVGNKIISQYDKNFIDDFYWVIGFTESHKELSYGLFESLKKYSNRKCLIYTINFDFELPKEFLISNQFILRRIDIPKGDTDFIGRDENIMSSKPIITIDAINYLPNKNFIYVDCDIYLTVNCDEIVSYTKELENYPLFNSHIHDRLYASNIIEGQWVSTIDILSEATGIPVTVFPRRKANLMIFNQDSKWFFEEQMSLYYEYRKTRPGIFRLHDEDSANILLSKYELTKSLPLIDMEESSYIDMEKMRNYSYNISAISEHVKLPKNENDIYCFHGFKETDFYKKIENDYGNTVLDCEEFFVTYIDNVIKFEKNSFLTSKKIENEVNFIIENIDNNEIHYEINNQLIFKYWSFYYSNIFLPKGKYNLKIIESNSKRIIFNDVLKIN
jgi:hypothetical protein